MDENSRFDIFEPGDPTALVCTDVPEVQRLIIEQLTDMHYRIHSGLSIEDLMLKMRAHVYDVIVISEHLGGGNGQVNPVLAEAISAPGSQRRRQLVVLVGASFTTGDELQAFRQSVDVVVGLSDAVNLRPLVRRGLVRMQEFYAPLQDALKEII